MARKFGVEVDELPNRLPASSTTAEIADGGGADFGVADSAQTSRAEYVIKAAFNKGALGCRVWIPRL